MRRIILTSTILLGASSALTGQTPTPAPTPTAEWSGLMFGAYSTRTDSAAKASLGGERPNAFSIDRVYITVKAPAGDNGAFRFTTDIFQNTNSATNGYYAGWVVRLKYAYFQYTALRDRFGKGSSLVSRVGSVHNIVIDQVDGPWPRYLQAIAVERVPYFSSADVGAGALLTLGHKWGEVYATVTNGPGYGAPEKDRFKDPAIRVTITPLANSSGMLKSLYVMPWLYKGYIGSTFSAGGAGQVGPGTNGAITDPLTRDRYGLLVGLRDRRVTVGAELAYQRDQGESGANTALSPRVVADSTGRMVDGYLVFRPIELLDASKRSPLSIVARYDHLTPNVDPTSPNYAGTTPSYDFTVIGAQYDLTQRISMTLDWQVDRPVKFPPPTGTLVRPKPRASVVYLHWQATF